MMPTANPLDQLKDIHLPEAVGAWPPAPGWWLLAMLLVVLLVVSLMLYKHRQKSAYRRAAVQQVKVLFKGYQQPQQSHNITGQLNCLLKATALQSYSRQQVSRLTETQWLSFLDSSANMQAFSQGAGQVLASAPYDKNSQITDAVALRQCCITWIRSHR